MPLDRPREKCGYHVTEVLLSGWPGYRVASLPGTPFARSLGFPVQRRKETLPLTEASFCFDFRFLFPS